MKIITAQMIRDKLGFNGPLSIRGLEKALDAPYSEFAKALAHAIERGYILKSIVDDTDIESIKVYSTQWQG